MWGKPKLTEETIQCSLTKEHTVYIELIPRHKIQLLMKEYTHQEWLAYLRGRISEQGNIFVEDISVPPHAEASAGSAEAEPFHIPKDCVGVIHSHHSMGAFHSGIDQTYVDKNFPVSIVVSSRDKGNLTYDAVSYMKTPCGKAMTLKAEVKYVQPIPVFNEKVFLKEAKAEIAKGKKVYATYNYNSGYYAGGYPLLYPQDEDKKDIPPAWNKSPFKQQTYQVKTKFGDVITDASGHVLSKKEMDDIIHNSTD